MKKIYAFGLAFVMALLLTFATGCNDEPNQIKIGIVQYDNTDAQQMAINNYFKNFFGENFGVEFVFSENITSAEQEIAFIENCAASGCQGIIAFYTLMDSDYSALEALLNRTKIYYMMGAAVTPMQKDAMKDCEYFVGGIGAGGDEAQDMYIATTHFLEKGDRKFLVSTGGYHIGVEMFIKRCEGIWNAIEDWNKAHPDDQATYDNYDGFPTGETWFAGAFAELTKGYDCVAATFAGENIWATPISQVAPETHLFTTTSANEVSVAALKSGVLDYMVCNGIQYYATNIAFMMSLINEGHDYLPEGKVVEMVFPVLYLDSEEAEDVSKAENLIDPNYQQYTVEDIKAVIPTYTKDAKLSDLQKLIDNVE